MAGSRGRPLRYGVERYDSGRIKHRKTDVEPQDGPRWSREYQWLRDNLSPKALEAAGWYADWIKHRNRWLGHAEWKLPGDDLTVSERMGRKCFTALLMPTGGYQPRRPDLSSDGAETEDREAPPPRLRLNGELTGKLAFEGPRPSAADAAADAMASDEAAQLLQQRYVTQLERYDSATAVSEWRVVVIPEGVRGKNVVDRKGQPYKFGAREMMGRPASGPFPPRKPFRPPDAPPPTKADEPCPECPGGCTTCEFRERIKIDHAALNMLLQQRTADDLRHARKKRALLDSFALDGEFPAPWEVAPLEEILMRVHQFFKGRTRLSDAKPLTGTEREQLFVKQSAYPPTPTEIILHVAKTEGIDLKYLGRVQSASAAAAVGDLYKKAS